MRKSFLMLASAAMLAPLTLLADTVLVTSLQGSVAIEAAGMGKAALEPFVRLKEGDRLSLPANAQVKLVYVGKARLETWQGAGIIVIGENESKASSGKPQIQVRDIPPEAARQMNRTPSTGPDGRVGMMRMRGLPPHDAITRLDNDYKQMRGQTDSDDILPEVFLLAGLYDLRQYMRIEEELKRIAAAYPENATARSLQELYTKAIQSAQTPPATPGASGK
jgi:hypothetical protein